MGADGPFEDKSKKHEGVGCTSGSPGILSKKIRIPLFEHFTHQLVIVLIEELVTVCIRSNIEYSIHPPISDLFIILLFHFFYELFCAFCFQVSSSRAAILRRGPLVLYCHISVILENQGDVATSRQHKMI